MLAYDSCTCPKGLFSLNGEQILLLYENSDLLAESDWAKAGTFSNYFMEVYPARIVENACRNHTGVLAIGAEHVSEETVLPLTTNLKPCKTPSPDRLHSQLLFISCGHYFKTARDTLQHVPFTRQTP
ncbi:unnamed protein product [Schistosoma mattheei]|uniref:Uncharacterized protein n=1 Tax=Schistosoma mattheei TaxID=31246 RepID=A0A183NG35_9TREM|nr:unnamed protein product [Schistosoma mattheei]